MTSLARRHRERCHAEMLAREQGQQVDENAAPEIDPNAPEASEYKQLLSALHNDLRALHDIQSVQDKIARKAQMIDTYLPWIEGALLAGADGRAVQDEIVVTIMIWAFDIQNWPLALDIAAHVLTHGLSLPERHKRTAACLVAEEVADAAKADPASVPFATLLATANLVEGRDMPDQVKAKLRRAIGLDLMLQAENFDPAAETATAGGKAALVDAALTALRDAVKHDQKVGVKKQIEQLEREAKRLAGAAAASQS